MATQTGKCGTTSVQYDDVACSYSCCCIRNNGCFWSVTCGKITVSGTGVVKKPNPGNSLTITGGTLAMAAKNLERLWDRPVIVPVKLRNQKVRKRTLTGTRDEMACALGFQLGPKRGSRSKRRAR